MVQNAGMDEKDTRLPITLRIPADLHAKLKASAQERTHSMNAEIVARLEGSFEERITEDMKGVRKILGGVFKRLVTPKPDEFSLLELMAQNDAIVDRMAELAEQRRKMERKAKKQKPPLIT